MKSYLVILPFLLGLGVQPAVAEISSGFCGDIVAADPAPAPAPEPEEEPDCE